ncbi:MAG: Lar family restriction alleviation protein [Acidovorax sp.]|uniref:hypothetical protein n=1 Tax=Acidovorax sp. TaxID=1872122 RepID=UPI0025C1E577|nr:hypothetical protein [Acidovorax sp.]MCE1194083.1 Lar family restriction alleviation protein [Acidovorax sp.]
MSKNDTLLPCPFCGASATGYAIEAHTHSGPLKALGIPDHSGSYVIEGNCACNSGLIGGTQAEVTERWNRRAPSSPPSADTLYLLRRLLSNQHTLTGTEFRAELTTIVQAAIEHQPPSVARGLRPTDLVNAAGILASDSPGAVVKKLEAAYDRATLKGGA